MKGALLVTTWFDNPLRPTRDLDLLGFGDFEADDTIAVFRKVCSIKTNDAVDFETAAIELDTIRDDTGCGGFRRSYREQRPHHSGGFQGALE